MLDISWVIRIIAKSSIGSYAVLPIFGWKRKFLSCRKTAIGTDSLQPSYNQWFKSSLQKNFVCGVYQSTATSYWKILSTLMQNNKIRYLKDNLLLNILLLVNVKFSHSSTVTYLPLYSLGRLTKRLRKKFIRLITGRDFFVRNAEMKDLSATMLTSTKPTYSQVRKSVKNL